MDPNSVPPFLTKTYEMVDDRSSDDVVAWSDGNKSFVVSDLGRFQTELLPKYFKHGNFASFVRQLNTYIGFRKVNSDRLEFANEAFLRGQKNLLQTILRRKHGNHPPQVQSSQAAVCIEMGKIGLKEDVEILQRDKNVLMQELVRLRQQQQATDHQLETVGQHMQMMEQRQQQMMSFLAKAMQSPGFLGQLVQKQSDSNCLVARGSKKRRFSRQDELNSVSGSVNDSSNIHIVRLHSSMNEAAKSMLHQILKMNSSRRDPVRTNLGPLLLDNLPCNSLENCSSASRITEVMLPKDLLSNGKSSVPVDNGFHGNPVDANVQFVQSMVTDQLEQKHLMDFNSQIYGQGESVPNFTEMPGNVTESFNGIPTAIPLESFSNPDFVDQLPSTINMATPGPSDPPEHDADILMDNMPVLPSINDVFWEQFLIASPPPLDIDELDLIIPESNTTKDQKSVPWQENGWDKFQRLNDLSEQMELLTSASAGV